MSRHESRMTILLASKPFSAVGVLRMHAFPLHPQESSRVLFSCAKGHGCLYIWLHPCFGGSLLLQEGEQVSPAMWGSRVWGVFFLAWAVKDSLLS